LDDVFDEDVLTDELDDVFDEDVLSDDLDEADDTLHDAIKAPMIKRHKRKTILFMEPPKIFVSILTDRKYLSITHAHIRISPARTNLTLISARQEMILFFD
jgi:hypothetical protein